MKVPFTLSHLTLMNMQHSIVTPFTDEGMKLKESKHRQEVPSRYVQLFALLGCLSGAGWGFLLQASFPSSFHGAEEEISESLMLLCSLPESSFLVDLPLESLLCLGPGWERQ